MHNLPPNWDDMKLEDTFAMFGIVMDVEFFNLINSFETADVGIVIYTGVEIQDRTITVELAN